MIIEIPETDPGKVHVYLFHKKTAEVIAVLAIALFSLSILSSLLMVPFNLMEATLHINSMVGYIALIVVMLLLALIVSIRVSERNLYLRVCGKTLTVVAKNGKETDYYLPDYQEFDRKGHGLKRFFLVFEQELKVVRVCIGSLTEKDRDLLLNDIETIREKGELPFEPGAEVTAEEIRAEEVRQRRERRKSMENGSYASPERTAMPGEAERERERIRKLLHALNHTDRYLIRQYMERKEKAEAIRVIREKTGAGLKDCKAACEQYMEELQQEKDP